MRRGLAVMGVVAVGMGACGGAKTDKAGGTREKPPTVLTFAAPNGDLGELQVWVDNVTRLSEGRLVVRPSFDWRSPQPDYEHGTIADVAAGKADLGWVGARAWTGLGVHGLDAFNAPFAVDSYDAQVSLLHGSAADRMLASVRKAGVEGVALLPGPMRYLLTKTAVGGAADLRGKTIDAPKSAVDGELLAALGAIAEPLPTGTRMSAKADGTIGQLPVLAGNGNGRLAKRLAAAPLSPRTFVIFANPKHWHALGEADRAILTKAAQASVAPMTELERDNDAAAFQQLCSDGVRAKPMPTDVRAAAEPIVRSLKTDAVTREALAGVEPGAADGATQAPCRKPTSEDARTMPNGIYTMTLRKSDHKARYVQDGFTAGDPTQTFTMTLQGNHMHLDVENHGVSEVGFDSDYSLLRDRVLFDRYELSMRWEHSGNRIVFSDVQSDDRTDELLTAHPWVRTGR